MLDGEIADTSGAMARIRSLEAVRGLAALAVLCCHTGPRGWSSFLSYGWLGVPVFFVLSGLVLYMPFIDKRVDTLEFWKRRLLRIFPGYWFALAICAAVALAAGGTVFRPLSQILLTQNYDGNETRVLITPSWTLAIELGFYLLLPALAWALWRHPAHRWSILAVIAGVAVAYRLNMNAPADTTHTLPLAPIGFLHEFVFGVAAAIAISRGLRSRWFAVAGAALIAASFVLLPSSQPEAFPFTDLVAAGIALALIPIAQSRIRVPTPLVWLGTISFGVYLWHVPIIISTGYLGLRTGIWTVDVAVIVTLTVIAAGISWRYVERPSIMLGRMHRDGWRRVIAHQNQ